MSTIKKKTKHRWTTDDCFAAIEIYKNGANRETSNIIAFKRGISGSSMWMAVQNVRYLATNGKEGLSRYSQQMKMAWEEYKKTKFIYK